MWSEVDGTLKSRGVIKVDISRKLSRFRITRAWEQTSKDRREGECKRRKKLGRVGINIYWPNGSCMVLSIKLHVLSRYRWVTGKPMSRKVMSCNVSQKNVGHSARLSASRLPGVSNPHVIGFDVELRVYIYA